MFFVAFAVAFDEQCSVIVRVGALSTTTHRLILAVDFRGFTLRSPEGWLGAYWHNDLICRHSARFLLAKVLA